MPLEPNENRAAHLYKRRSQEIRRGGIKPQGREMNDDAQKLCFEHEEAMGWRAIFRDQDDSPILMSTKPYPKLREMVTDLKALGDILGSF